MDAITYTLCAIRAMAVSIARGNVSMRTLAALRFDGHMRCRGGIRPQMVSA